MMLLFNIGAAALLLPLRYGLGGAALATSAMFGEFIWTALRNNDNSRPLAELMMFGVSYLAIAMLTYLLGRQMRDSQALAERRGAQVANLAEINELIIRRMVIFRDNQHVTASFAASLGNALSRKFQ